VRGERAVPVSAGILAAGRRTHKLELKCGGQDADALRTRVGRDVRKAARTALRVVAGVN
jgi:hypothetical protein